MAPKEREISGRTKIVEILARYPGGLNAARIRKLVIREHAISESHVASLLVHLAREGKITNQGLCSCDSCGRESVIYKTIIKESPNGQIPQELHQSPA